MRTRSTVVLVAGAFTLALVGVRSFSGAEPERRLDADKIGQAAGVKATTTQDGVVRIAMHIGGIGNPEKLAKGIKAALDKQAHCVSSC